MLFILFILGLIVGSFLNVCIYRIPKNKSIVFPPSSCTFCNAKLKPIDLIPVLSCIFLGGKCRYCRSKISIVYPVVEIISGINFAVFFLLFGFALQFWFYAFIMSLLVIIFFIDLKNFVIPDSLVAIGVILSFGYWAFQGKFTATFIGALFGFGIMLLIFLLGNYFFKKEATGFGDVTLSAMLGAILGFPAIIVALFLAYLLAALISIPLLVLKLRSRRDIIPFGPFLVISAAISIFWGNAIIGWYLSL